MMKKQFLKLQSKTAQIRSRVNQMDAIALIQEFGANNIATD